MSRRNKPSEVASRANQERIHEIVNDCLVRRTAGEVITDESVMAAHPELMPDLAEWLNHLQILDQIGTPAGSRAESDREEQRVCPNCDTPLGMEDETSHLASTCPSCGQHVGMSADQSNSSAAEVSAKTGGAAPTAGRLDPQEPRAVFSDPAIQHGTKIGRYKILSVLGEGGCGMVYLAESGQPVKRRLALKVIKPGMDSKQVVARFGAERQALAMMDHPCVAKVFDAGMTEAGRPYFVMEYVKGVPLTQHCDRHKLNIRERMNLFIAVCEAVQHAHQKGVIHRDIKPSNVLVTVDGNRDLPKVIDFGLAKAMHQSLTDQSLFTQQGQIIGTPEYMSPEQAEMTAQDIDTRTDIYSLGVVLYELLTGVLPFERKSLRGRSDEQLRRAIREQNPPTPSARLSTLEADRLTVVIQARRIELRELRRELKGDLDWIVLKSLEKDRKRRYETANGLAMDIQRYLRDEPVIARPPSSLYLLSKMARRNKVVFAATAAVFLALLVGLSLATWGLSEAKRERDIANKAEKEAVTAKDLAIEAQQIAERQSYLSHLAAADKALLRDAYRRARIELGACPLEQRGWEWHFLAERLGSTFTSIAGSGPPIFTRDGNRLIAIGTRRTEDESARIWDLTSSPPREIGALRRPRRTSSDDDYRPLTYLSMSPDETRIAGGDSNGDVFVWNVEGGWNAAAARVIREGTGEKIDGLAFSSDGELVASVDWNNTLTVLNAANGQAQFPPQKIEERHPKDTSHLREVMFSPDGLWIATSFNHGEAFLVDVISGKIVERFPFGHKLPIFSAGGQLVATGNNDGSIALWKWDGLNLEMESQWQADQAPVWALRFYADGTRLVSGHRRSSVKLWDTSIPLSPAKLAVGGELAAFFGRDYARNLAKHPTSEQIAINTVADGIEFWRYQQKHDGQSQKTLKLHDLPVWPAKFSPDGRWIAFGTDKPEISSAFFSLNTSGTEEGLSKSGTAGAIRSLVISDAQGVVRGMTASPLDGLAWTPDSRHIFASTEPDFAIHKLDVETLKSVGRSFTGHTARALVFCSRSGQKITSVDQDRRVQTWDVRSGRRTNEFVLDTGTEKPISGLAISPSGNRLAASVYWEWDIEIWDTRTRERELEIPVPGHYVRQLVFTKDEERLFVGSNGGKLELIDLSTRNTSKTFTGHRHVVQAIAVNPDETQIVAGDSTGQVIVWDVASEQPLVTLTDDDVEVTSLDWSPDGKQIVAGKLDGTVRIWTLPGATK